MLEVDKLIVEFNHIWPILCPCHTTEFSGNEALYYVVRSGALRNDGYLHAAMSSYDEAKRLMTERSLPDAHKYCLILNLYLVHYHEEPN